ncbi:hypothetical protein [Asanoa sp. NPDC050611]|uniref:hypothetical protein n=1 Tax=Asanoa sp. NPDC050611 TaxID=3157098 RepID=UPI00340032BB
MSVPPTGKVARARILPPLQGRLDRTPTQALCEALTSGVGFTRAGRLWRLGNVRHDTRYVRGQLGYERDVDTARWQERNKAFEQAAMLSGSVAPFVLRLADLTVAFQTRGHTVGVSAFVSALQTMVCNATTERDWLVAQLTDGGTFADWRERVDTVTRLRVRTNRKTVGGTNSVLAEVFHEVNAASAYLDVRSDDGLNTNGPLCLELLEMAEHGEADALAIGRSNDELGAEYAWQSALGGQTVLVDAAVEPTTGMTSEETLIAHLEGGAARHAA